MPKTERYVIPEGEHSPLGPSASERWLNCPGSVLLTIDLPDKDSVYSVEGTAAHTVTEWARMEGRDAREYIGREVDVELAQGGTRTVVVDEEMADCTNAFSEYTDALGGEMLCEERVCYDGWVEKGFGTADDIRLQDGIVPITDYKYGKGVKVWAENNTQLMLYALGIFQMYASMYDIKGFRLAIFQPRLNHIDEWEISVEDLLVWANTVAKPGAELALTKDAPLKAGDHCQFCLVKGQCKTRAKYVYDVIYADEFEDLDERESDVRDPRLLTPEEIGLLLPMVASGKRFFDDLEAHAYAEIGKGVAIPHPTLGDWKLVEGRANRVFALPEEELVPILELEMTEEELYTKKLCGVPAVEKKLGKKHVLIAGDEEAGIAPIWKKPRGKPKLVNGMDKRPSMEVHADDEFEDLES